MNNVPAAEINAVVIPYSAILLVGRLYLSAAEVVHLRIYAEI